MKLAGALVLLGDVLFLTSGGDCGLCPVIETKVELFFLGTLEDYLKHVKAYTNNTVLLEEAERMKNCVYSKLTEEDKTHIANVIERIKASHFC
ncbi:major allergen I polypeptide chain 1-like [Apodemus sylvaticus]|uniref:major allergen I polypeptide chain 1-like n=1 Tax=Apodemus sylvaticus TaxID=10129 RepID=UPI002241D719|nr:major allergen I polypeptide chain 1-like [Apodemus sylvaticus]XP_052035298.1 major allergen I polypeptide chain 1-like [Apodemus sylvaticus]